MFVPLFIYLGWITVLRNILARPKIDLFPIDDLDLLAVSILFCIYGFVGNTIHFTGKILWRYLKKDKRRMAYKVNEMFHGKLSHYLVFLNVICVFFLLQVIEINHPVFMPVSSLYLDITFIAGVIFGISGSKSTFYTNEWFGGYNKPLFFVVSVIVFTILSLHRIYRMNYHYYPVNLFVVAIGITFSTSFVIRQFFIFLKLKQKRRLRFLAKIFSA